MIPRELLHHVCSLPHSYLTVYLSYLHLNPSYVAHHALGEERPFLPNEGENGIYLGHFVGDLSFSSDSDLVVILDYYNLPLC